MPRIALFLLLLVSFVHADEYDDLRLKLRGMLIGTGYDVADPTVAAELSSIASAANSTWSSMDKSPTRTFLWSDQASTTDSSHLTNSYTRLRGMALAYSTPGCSLQGNATLLADIVGGLDWMFANRYGATTAQYFNWWDWEIGSPLRLTDICVLLYDQLTATQLTNYMNAVNFQVPIPDMTQANQVWKARVVGVRGCLVKSSAKLLLARDAFSAVFPYVTSGDGYYTDGSFIQHNYLPSTASYGGVLIATMAPTLAWLSGSTWAVTDPAQNNLFRWVFDSYEPIIYNGNLFDLVRGRDIGNANVGSSADSMMASILQIAQFAPPADAARMKSMVKEWALADYTRNFVSNRSLSTVTVAKQMMNDPGVVRRGELIKHYTFAEMDRVIHLGAGYGFGLSMCSTRITNFESINGENLRGWFTGDGQTILYNGDLAAFGDSYWATVDHTRLPGVTADVTHSKPPTSNTTGPRALGQSTLSTHSWVGGATLGNYGAAGMQFKGVGVTLTGKKSWFMFDDEIVCLGSGITSSDSRPIETTIEQRKLNSAGTNAFTVNGTTKSTAPGTTETMTGTSWAHLVGNVTGSDIGYYFPTSPTVKATREARTGAWSDIDSSGSTTPITRNYLRMTLEHGNSPTNGTYQYVLLPGRNATRTGHYAAAPQVTVLANNANVQAVTETTLGITAANFWTDTSQTIGGITSNKKASVLVRDDGTFIDVSVSDPTQLNTGTIALQLALNGGTLVGADAGVTVTQSTPTISMSVNMASAAGKSFKARFYKLTPQIVNLTPLHDSYVFDGATSLDTSYGTENKLVIKKAGAGFNRESFLRFEVPAGSNGLLLGGTLDLTCTTTTTPGVNAVAKVDENTWGETTVAWNNKPSAGSVLDTWTPVINTTTKANVASAIPSSGLISFKVYATTETSNGIVYYGSKEHATVANRPQLSLTYGRTPPEVSITTPADGTFIGQAGNVTLTADVVVTDGAITSIAFYDGATLLGTDSSAPYSITPSLTSGPHFLKAVATDANGLSRTSFTTRVDVANPPPVKAATGSTLNLGTAWTGALVPVNPDTATWNATSLTGAMTLGANLSWAGLIVNDPAGALTFNGTQTLTLGSGGVDMSGTSANLTFNHPVILGENQTWNIDAGTLAANGMISGPGTLTKTGAGDVTLSAANALTGITTINQGTLAFTTANSLTGGISFGTAATNLTPGILDSTTSNATFAGAITVNTNSTTTSEIKIGAARTLTLNNNLQIGATTPTVTGTVTKLTLTGGGVFNVATAAGGSFLVGGSTASSVSQSATLDLTALSATTIHASTAGTLRVGTNTGSNFGGQGQLLLPTPGVADTLATTTLTAGTIGVGVGGSNNHASWQNRITLGTGRTQLNADNINVGTGGRDLGQIIYGQAAGDLIIRGAAGGSTRAIAINVGSIGGGTASVGLPVLVDFSGHDADILVTSLNVGNQARAGTQSYVFNFGAGDNSLASELDATNVNIGFRGANATTATSLTSRVNLSGGTVTFGNVGATGTGVDIGSSIYVNPGAAGTVGELNISGGNVTIHHSTALGAAVRLGTNQETGGGTVTATFNLTGGTTTLGGDIIRNAVSPRTTSTLKVSGGTLDMGGHDIGTATEPITFTTESGTISNIKSINGTAGLTKTTANTLTIAGTSTYSGTTTVSNGTLALNGSLTGALTVNGGTFAASGLPATAGAFSLNSTGTYQTRINGTTAGTLYDQLTAGGSVTLSGPLDLIAGPGLAAGTSLIILNKTSAGAISGIFTGKPEGSAFTEDGYTWIVSYLGGDGNDATLTIPTALQTWRNTHFGTMANSGSAADTFDANGDGELNLLEFATGQNPIIPTFVTLSTIRNPSAVEVTYSRSNAALNGGMIFRVEWSDTLDPGSWSTAGVTQSILTDNGTLQSIKATVPALLTVERRFARLKVTQP
jgi:hyaluronate lyase